MKPNLSEKIEDLTGGDFQEVENWDGAIDPNDVKEKIKDFDTELKEEDEGTSLIDGELFISVKKIDKLKLKHFGKELI